MTFDEFGEKRRKMSPLVEISLKKCCCYGDLFKKYFVLQKVHREEVF